MSLTKFDQARLDGYQGTLTEYASKAFRDGGILAARSVGFDGSEADLVALVASEDAIVEKRIRDEQAQSDQRSEVVRSMMADKDFVASITGADGLDAYQLAQAKGYDGELQDWLVSLSGADGSSAYEIALQRGYDGTEDEWLKALVGLDGMSAYDLWVSVGNNGSMAEFLASLKGEKGDKGDQGEQGERGEKGEQGETGPAPRHQWDGTRLRFERPDGTWGAWVDLKGAMGAAGSGGGGSLSIQKFYDGVDDFPLTGTSQVLYFDKSTDPYGVYVWADGDYQQVGGGEGSGTAYTVAIAGKNTTGATIPKGTAVMATGTLGSSGIITIAPMDGTNPDNYKYLIGIAGEDILADSEGDVVDIGKVRKFDTSMWAEGDVLWVSTTVPGALTNVEPSNGLKMPVAFVVTDHVNVGEIMVRVTPINEAAFIQSSFETVSKNLKAYDFTLNYMAGELTSVVYSNGVTKSLSYTAGELTTITLSGSTPGGIDLIKTLTYTSGELTAVAYS